MQNSGQFRIFTAVKNAYAFVGREWLYLLKAALLPIGVQIILSIFVQYERPQASLIEDNLWDIPSAMLLGWFLFLEMRLLLLGERQNRLPPDRTYRADRSRAMQAAVLASVLFSMTLNVSRSLIALLWVTVAEAAPNAADGLVNGCMMLSAAIIGAIVWGLRFGIVPILAAVHHPIRPVLRQTRSLLFSFRLLAMGLLATLPIIFLFQLLVGAAIPGAQDLSAKLTDQQQLAITIINAPLSVLCAALLAAGAADALKQILGTNRSGGVA